MKKIFLLLLICFALPAEDLAFEAYTLGERAQTTEEREKYFNQALKIYSEQSVMSSKLHFNLANCYYQLGQMGMAIWHYQKARALSPRDSKVMGNMRKAYESAGIEISSMQTVLRRLFFFHTKLHQSERTLILYTLATLSFVLFSLFIWLGRAIYRTIGVYSASLMAVFAISLLITQGQTKRFAILVQPTLVRCDAGDHYKAVSEEIELAGARVKIKGFSEDGKWVRVKTPHQTEGYVLAEKIRAI